MMPRFSLATAQHGLASKGRIYEAPREHGSMHVALACWDDVPYRTHASGHGCIPCALGNPISSWPSPLVQSSDEFTQT